MLLVIVLVLLLAVKSILSNVILMFIWQIMHI